MLFNLVVVVVVRKRCKILFKAHNKTHEVNMGDPAAKLCLINANAALDEMTHTHTHTHTKRDRDRRGG